MVEGGEIHELMHYDWVIGAKVHGFDVAVGGEVDFGETRQIIEHHLLVVRDAVGEDVKPQFVSDREGIYSNQRELRAEAVRIERDPIRSNWGRSRGR